MKTKIKNNIQNKLSIEDTFKKLDKIITAMEKEDISIEDSLKYYKEGITMIKNAKSSIDRIEKQIEVIDEF